jgi:hypothetical protein
MLLIRKKVTVTTASKVKNAQAVRFRIYLTMKGAPFFSKLILIKKGAAGAAPFR